VGGDERDNTINQNSVKEKFFILRLDMFRKSELIFLLGKNFQPD